MLFATLMITGLMACSDIEEDGITQREVEDTQAQMEADIDLEEAPLYVINGEVVNLKANIMSRLKPKYVEKIDVLKGKKATEAYNQKGRNSVTEIALTDKEKAMADLRTDEEIKTMKERLKRPCRPIFRAKNSDSHEKYNSTDFFKFQIHKLDKTPKG